MPYTKWISCLVMTVGLAACGGGDSPATADVTVVPPTAVASVTAFVSYTAGLTDDDTREPLGVEGLMPPTSETAEPEIIVRP